MITGDIIKVRFVIEIAGVATSIQHYWRVQTVAVDNPSQALDDLAALFWSSITSLMAPSAQMSCATWENLTRPEVAAIYPSLAGTAAGESAPPSTVLRINRYGLNPAGGKNKRSSVNISGVNEAVSVRGRVRNSAPFLPVQLYFSSQQTGPVTNNTFFPSIRYVTGVGPPEVSDYVDAYSAQVQFRMLILARRKSKLCAR